MSVGRICATDVDTAEVDESAWEAAERMHQRVVGSLVVTNQAGQPVGIVTDRDLVERVLAQNLDPHQTRVDEIMTAHPLRVRKDESIRSAVALMRSGGFRRLPVVDGDDKLVGLLSLDDVLMLFCEEFCEIGELLKKETPRAVAESLA